MVDTDNGSVWDENGLASTFGYGGWDFVGSNGILVRRDDRASAAVQYDAWAFRAEGSFRPLSTKAVNRFNFPYSDGLAPVFSCFGGLGVYRMEALLSAQYGGGDCEHVVLHAAMRSAGFDRTYLNPAQVVHYGERLVRSRRLWRHLSNGWSLLSQKGASRRAA